MRFGSGALPQISNSHEVQRRLELCRFFVFESRVNRFSELEKLLRLSETRRFTATPTSPAAATPTGADPAGRPQLAICAGPLSAYGSADPVAIVSTATPASPGLLEIVADPLHEALYAHFGYRSFLPHQETIIRTVLDGSKDVLFVAHTGAGKSLAFQLPALMFAAGNVTVVVSPLISLMADQVTNPKLLLDLDPGPWPIC